MRILFIITLFFCLVSGYSHALESDAFEADQLDLRLFSAVDSIGEDDFIEGIAVLRLKEGWHTYWRSPGDSGLAPTFDWSKSSNIEDVKVLWPAPKRFDEYGVQTFGYSGEVAFPVDVTLSTSAQATVLDLQLSVLVCRDICIPQHLSTVLEIPAGDGEAGEDLKSVDFAKTKTPSKTDLPGLKIENVTAGPKAVVVNAFSQKGFLSTDTFVEFKEGALTTRPKITVDPQDQRKAQITIGAPENIENFFAVVKENDITVTLTNGQESVERRISF